MMKILFYSLVFSFFSCAHLPEPSPKNALEHFEKPYVIVMSIDGYRFDYTQKFKPPFLSSIEANAIAAKSLVPVFPSKTFTSHYSILTGLYPEHHGIVSNYFFDFTRPEGKQHFALHQRPTITDPTWYGGVPLWSLAEKQLLLTGNVFFPIDEFPIAGYQPTYRLKFDLKVDLHQRLKRIKEWLNLSIEERPHLLFLYYEGVDQAGHKFGPNSDEVRNTVLHLDQILSTFWQDLKKTELPIHLFIISDHGMEDIPQDHTFILDEHFSLAPCQVGSVGTFMQIYCNDSTETERVHQQLLQYPGREKIFSIYKREDVPPQLRLGSGPRVGDIFVKAFAPYLIVTKESFKNFEKGNHGYDPATNKNMHGIFYMTSTIQNLGSQKLPSTPSVDLYPLIARILSLNLAHPIDGRDHLYKTIFKKEKKEQEE